MILCTGYRKGSVTSYASRLSARGFIYREGSRSFATAAGFAALPEKPKPSPSGRKLIEHYIQTLPPGEALVLQHLLDAAGHSLTIEALVKRSGRPIGSISSYVSRLRTREILSRDGQFVNFSSEVGL